MAYLSIFTILFGIFLVGANGINNNFQSYYSYLWGSDHFYVNPQGTEVQLKFDNYSGAGFRSKSEYGSGLFQIRMKIPERKTGGIVPNFYLTSAPDNQDPGDHFELDYEFLGTSGIVQTNVYANDKGHREQSFKLWFDPSKDFHTYEILWNPFQIVFSIDNIPIRVFRNNWKKGVAYPNLPMHIEASIWNANWAGNVDWSQAPFITHYSDFGFNACTAQGNNISACVHQPYFWNLGDYRALSRSQRRQMNYYRKKYMVYDYCSKQSTWKTECSLNF